MLKDETLNYIKESALHMLEQIPDSLKERLDTLLEKITVSVEVFPIQFKDNIIFIATGTPQDPKGLSNFKGDFVVITNFNDKHYFFRRAELVKLIKENKDSFKRTTGPDFETMGFLIKQESFEKLIQT